MSLAMSSVTGLKAPATQCRAPVTRSLRVCCQAGPRPVEAPKVDLRTMTAGIAAAALMFAGTAHAGVILQPTETKKVFQGGATPTEKVAATPAGAPAAPKPKKVESVSEGGPDLKGLILPAALVALAGGGYGLAKIDPGFGEVFATTIIKDSNIDGAGYEAVLKNGALTAAKGTKGTKKVAVKGKK